MTAVSDFPIRTAGVLGAGAMGSRIAAHLGNAGIQVMLLDLPSDPPDRSAVGRRALEAIAKSRPPAFYDPSFASRITPGNFDDDLPRLAECDWVIEAVAEDFEIKRSLLERAAPHIGADAVFTTNTSGLSVARLAAGLPERLRSRWFGAHFFNPPRYMRLVEIIPGPETDQRLLEAMAHFVDRQLGKEVVFARDTPNFIANRIGIFIMLEAVRLMVEEDLTVEEVDALTGEPIGWPRSGALRLADLVGLDVVAQIAANFPSGGPWAERQAMLPPFIRAMLERRWLGDKTRQGFYRKDKDASGKEVRYVLDWKNLEYRPAQPVNLPYLDRVKRGAPLADRIRTLLAMDAGDRGARFHWRLLSALWNYAAGCLSEIADDPTAVDRAMRAGFNWEMGPFELWDAAGVAPTVARMAAAGQPASQAAGRLLASGADSWYRDSGRQVFDPASQGYRPAPHRAGAARVAHYREKNGVVDESPGVALVDIGDGIGCIELRSGKGLTEDAVRFIAGALQPGSEAVRTFAGFVVTGDAANFSASPDLAWILAAALKGDWNQVDSTVRSLQDMAWAIKFCPSPVVAAPFGQCLGAGATVTLASPLRNVHAELYMGFTDSRLGLIPIGGVSNELTLRAVGQGDAAPGKARMLETLSTAFDTLAAGRVSTSAVEARRLGLLSENDRVTMNRERLLDDAKELARAAAGAGYSPPKPRTGIPAPGEDGLAALARRLEAGLDGEPSQKAAHRLAYVLCGGNVATGTPVSERLLLDLEREAFLSLCGDAEVRERISALLGPR